ncbi:MAG: DUF1269 domain-containing protein [Planctomycetes bacterium]|nr:DUF1269 domain-containing protein [Planctomycetota bacterium]
MDHILFARFPDRRHAIAGVRAVRERGAGATRMVAHFGATDAAEFEQVVQHSGEFAETDLRHAIVVGGVSGLLTGAVLGLVLALVGFFPGTPFVGLGFGALMGVLVGLLMMSIFGTGLMDRRLQRLTQNLHAGEVVITVRTVDRATCDQVQQALTEHGAQVAEKSLA